MGISSRKNNMMIDLKMGKHKSCSTKTSLINQLAKSKAGNEHRNRLMENHKIQAKNFEL